MRRTGPKGADVGGERISSNRMSAANPSLRTNREKNESETAVKVYIVYLPKSVGSQSGASWCSTVFHIPPRPREPRATPVATCI